MPRASAHGLFFVAVVTGAVGCTKAATPASSSSAVASSGTGSSTGATTGSSSGGTTQGTASSSGAGSSTTGTTTGAPTPSPFVDGGYVDCSLTNVVDGGLMRWMCEPGTYFCDTGGETGNCFQCRSDTDCADQSLPTYDPSRLHCDLDSGIPGYQSFCVQCLKSADCAGNPAGPLCDFNPTYPPFEFQPSIEDLGFETCGKIQTDCRLLGGPACAASNQICDVLDGQCEARPTSCATDQDCGGGLLPSRIGPASVSAYLPLPYCVNGTCNACDGGVCPNDNACTSDADCGNPFSSAAGLHCVLNAQSDGGSLCGCTDSSQCGGFWPACILDAGFVDDAGQPLGVCSCESDAQCGDGGLVCLPWDPRIHTVLLQTIFRHQAGANYCGLPCTSPDFGACAILTGYATCYVEDRVCAGCDLSEECMSALGAGGPFCSAELFGGVNGGCVCILDSDCPPGFACSALPGACIPIPNFSRCTPDTCKEYFCNWDSGSCNDLSGIYTPNCLSDFDCPAGVCVEGACVGCRDNANCLVSGATSRSFCCLDAKACTAIGASIGSCIDFCATDQHCLGNLHGPSCVIDAGSHEQCGCRSNVDCAAGLRCEPAGLDDAGICIDSCTADGGCPSGFRCDWNDACQPACDHSRDCDGALGCARGACQPCVTSATCDPGTFCLADGLCHAACDAGVCPGAGVCDSIGAAGGGANVCYQCLSAVDCPDGEGCNGTSHTCGTCLGPTAKGGSFDCPPDAICSNYWGGATGVCLQNCDREPCPTGRPICAVFPALTPEHKYCFGCLQDSECVDGGTCDESFNRTFTCSPG